MNMPMVLVLVLLAAGCAHSQKKEVASEPGPTSPAVAELSSDSPAAKRIPLPYAFSRRGVNIRVNSVEFAKDKLQVSVTLQEVRGQEGSILTSTLMEPRTPAKHVLPYSGYARNSQTHTESQINLTPNEKLTIDLLFQLPAEASATGTPMEIQFTTGKWWSSQSRDSVWG